MSLPTQCDPQAKIALIDVTRRFEDGFHLNIAQLSICEGEVYVLIGPSAAGKTVLLKMIAGLYRPDSGSIRINGKETVGLAPERRDAISRTGMLFQRSALFDSMTVWENITFRRPRTHRLSRAAAIELAAAKLVSVGLDADTAFLYPSELSGGMQKRVGLARALADDPDILLLDEPTAGLDPVLTSLIIDRLIFHKEKLGATAVVVTSNLTGALAIADRIGIVRAGQITWSGAPDHLGRSDDPFAVGFVQGTPDS